MGFFLQCLLISMECEQLTMESSLLYISIILASMLAIDLQMSILKGLFGSGKSVAELMEAGAVIVDVRSAAEFAGGHVKNSINIPLDELAGKLSKLDRSKPVVTCCASGIRSASAKRILKANGFHDVANGGGWASLKKYE